jgi:hypothetical protein
MVEQQINLLSFYKGWDAYQALLIKAIEPLPSDKLALRVAPHLRSIGENVAHIISGRVSNFLVLGEAGAKVEVASAPDGDGPYQFNAFGEYFVEEIPDRGIWAGEKGTDSLEFLIPEDLVGAFPDEANVQIIGTYYDIEGKGGYWGVVQEVIRVDQP